LVRVRCASARHPEAIPLVDEDAERGLRALRRGGHENRTLAGPDVALEDRAVRRVACPERVALAEDAFGGPGRSVVRGWRKVDTHRKRVSRSRCSDEDRRRNGDRSGQPRKANHEPSSPLTAFAVAATLTHSPRTPR